MDNTYDLNTKWVLWFHSINNKKWDIKSYNNILEINDLLSLKSIFNVLIANHYQNGMFFIMRNNILPMWEYPDNRDGYCLSYKIPASELKENCDNIIKITLTEEIFMNKDDHIKLNGISISPKKEFNIIKLWFRENIDYKKVIREYPPFILHSKSIYKKNISS